MYIFGMISGNKMEEIADEVLADLTLDEGLDSCPYVIFYSAAVLAAEASHFFLPLAFL